MQPLEQLAYILPTLSSVVDRIDSGRLHDRLPGRSETVHDALDTMILVGDACAHWFRGEAAPHRTAPAVHGRVPAVEYRAVMDALLAAVKVPGALDGRVAIPGGDRDADEFARIVALNALVHGWDLAIATGLRFEVPPGVIAAADEFAHGAGAGSSHVSDPVVGGRCDALMAAGRST